MKIDHLFNQIDRETHINQQIQLQNEYEVVLQGAMEDETSIKNTIFFSLGPL